MTRFGPMEDLMVGEREADAIDELQYLINQFDELFEHCMHRCLTNEEHHDLNRMHEALANIENAHWEGVSARTFALLQSRLDTDFPMIRYTLGMLPTDQH